MERFMLEALKQAEIALKNDEVPIGCVIVRNRDGKIIAKAYNRRASKKDATMHAEIIAIRKACKVMGDWRLNDCTLYVTLEPCPMCAGAILNARIGKVVYGAVDEKSGFFGGVEDISQRNILNHSVEVVGGFMQNECSYILNKFFKSKRKNQN